VAGWRGPVLSGSNVHKAAERVNYWAIAGRRGPVLFGSNVHKTGRKDELSGHSLYPACYIFVGLGSVFLHFCNTAPPLLHKSNSASPPMQKEAPPFDSGACHYPLYPLPVGISAWAYLVQSSTISSCLINSIRAAFMVLIALCASTLACSSRSREHVAVSLQTVNTSLIALSSLSLVFIGSTFR
jgi:hypothetical protein